METPALDTYLRAMAEKRLDSRPLEAELSALKQRASDLELMLRAITRGHWTYRLGRKRTAALRETPWTFFNGNGVHTRIVEAPDDGTGLPLLDAAARKELRASE